MNLVLQMSENNLNRQIDSLEVEDSYHEAGITDTRKQPKQIDKQFRSGVLGSQLATGLVETSYIYCLLLQNIPGLV